MVARIHIRFSFCYNNNILILFLFTTTTQTFLSFFYYSRGPPKLTRKVIQGPPVIRLLPITHCKNRRFYRIAVQRLNSALRDPIIEDLGSIDPMPNKNNQILVAINFDRLKYYLSRSVPLKGNVGHYLGK